MRGFHHHSVVHSSYHLIPGRTGNLLTVLLALALAVSCGGPEPVNPDPDPSTPVTPVTPEKDTQAPVITVSKGTVNVIAGPAVTVSGSELKIGDQSVATWKDDKSANCTVALTLTPTEGTAKSLNSGDKLSEAGKLQIKATDEAGNSSTADVDLTAVAVYGLENLQNKQLQVDQEVNLMEGITIAGGLTLTKVEAEQDGIRTEVANPNAFVPEYPGSVNIILTLAKPGGNTITVTTGNLNVKPLDYTVAVLKTADVINSYYAWFNNIQSQSKKAFVYPHLLTSYITGERYKLDNLEYIVMGEIPKYTQEYENVNIRGLNSTPDGHADNSCAHVKEIAAPLSTIKVCGGVWDNLLNYISLHPDKLFMISCAWDSLTGSTLENFKKDPLYSVLKEEILTKKNVIVIIAGGNHLKYILNENQQDKEGGNRNSSSVNSSNPNKITVVGFDTDKQNIFQDDQASKEPLGFGRECNNIVIPFTQLVHRTGGDLTGTESSFPTAAVSGTLGNFLSIMMHNHPGTTLADADSIFWDEFLIPQYFQHKNDDGTIENAGIWYFFNTEKFFDVEILHKAEIIQALSAAAPISSATAETPSVALPSHPGLIYEGPGIYFTANGQEHEMTGTNRTVLESAVKSGADLSWRYSPSRARKYGIPPSLTVHILDTKAQIVPDVTLSVELK